MFGTQSNDRPTMNAPAAVGRKQDTSMINELVLDAAMQDTPIECKPTHGSLADFDFVSAAKKLKCAPDSDSVSSAIGILLNELDNRNKKIAFYESLFGYPTEYLMACKGSIIKYDDIIFCGQRRLQGEVLKKVMLERLGKDASMEQIAGKTIIENVQQGHYDFAVVLPVKAKSHVDRELYKLRAEEAKTRKESADAVTKGMTCDPPAKSLSKEKVVEKEKLQRTLSQGPPGLRALAKNVPVGPQPASTDAMPALKTFSEVDEVRVDDKAPKRKHTIVISDDGDDKGDNVRAKMNKVA